MTFTNPTVLNVTTQTVSVEGQDYFYWPCLSGEKYAPTFAATSLGIASGYSSTGLYPSVVTQASSATTAAATTRLTWPILPAFKYSASSFTGYTIRFRMVAVVQGSSINGVKIFFNSSTSDWILFQESSNYQGYFGNATAANPSIGNFGAGTYSCVATWSPAGLFSFTMNGTTIYNNANGSNCATNAPQMIVQSILNNQVSSPTQYAFHFSQIQLTYT